MSQLKVGTSVRAAHRAAVGHADLHRAAGELVFTGRAVRCDGSADSWCDKQHRAGATVDDRADSGRAEQRHLFAPLAHSLDRRWAHRTGLRALTVGTEADVRTATPP